MKKQTQAISHDMSRLAEDASALMAATTDTAGEQIGEARKRLAAALERTKEIYGQLRQVEVDGAKAADDAMHAHPYIAIALGVGFGALLTYLIANRIKCNNG